MSSGVVVEKSIHTRPMGGVAWRESQETEVSRESIVSRETLIWTET
jgi:hypothetical protein